MAATDRGAAREYTGELQYPMQENPGGVASSASPA
ncbi:hypothetical protein J2808_004394 [Pseudarthrobacter sulfonivorans]|nr:hypothetical protein [Pseudarthrobacter sulfonivorans]